MRCLFCDEEIDKESLYSLLIEKDSLCYECRKKIIKRHEIENIAGIEVESFYDYDSLFKSLLLQYKECYDEALKEVFLYGLNDYLKLKYHSYKVLYVPSSEYKIRERGFNHLEMIFDKLNLDKVEGLVLKEELVQEGKGLKDREKMIDNYLYTGKKIDKVLIVDDVLTSGSSIQGVIKAIQPYCDKLKGVVLSKKRKRFHLMEDDVKIK